MGRKLALQSAMAHPPSLILLDVRMPDMDGFEVCRRLKQDERTRDVPIIFVSALQDVDDRVQGFEVGGVDFVSKPIRRSRGPGPGENPSATAYLCNCTWRSWLPSGRPSWSRPMRPCGKARRGIAPWSNKPRTGSSYFKMARSGLPIRMWPALSGRTVEELLDTPFEAYLAADQIPQKSSTCTAGE